MLFELWPLAVAFILVLTGTPAIKKMAVRIKAFDKPDARKVHMSLMPRMGGLAICLGFWTAIILSQELSREICGLLLGGLIICLLGAWDDLRGVPAWQKLIVQIAAAAVVLLSGVRVEFVTNPFSGVINLGFLSYPVTILWIIGITNAVNLIDGLDGLAAGVAAIAAVTLGVVAYVEALALGQTGIPQASVIAFILAACSLGFLWHNFYPAKIFMGDTGSLFLGFNLAILAILGLTKSTTFISLFLPVVILGIPIMDTMLAIVRRYNNKKPLLSPDKDHLHHRLLALGLTHRRTVLIIYGVSAVLSITAVFMAFMTDAQGMLAMLVITLGVFIAAERTGVLKSSVAAQKPEQEKAHRHLAK